MKSNETWECALPVSVGAGDFMAAFHVYVDESGKFTDTKVDYISMCGYAAHISEWAHFGSDWQNCRLRWQIPALHLRAIYRADDNPEWSKVKRRFEDMGDSWDVAREQMLDEFATIVAQSGIVSCGAVVDSKYWHSLPPSNFKTQSNNPLFLAFHQVVMRALDAIEMVDSRSTIGLVLDNDEESSQACFEQLATLRKNFLKVKERFSSICFVNDEDYPGVQAADFLAFEARKFMVDRIKDPACEIPVRLKKLCGLNVKKVKLYSANVLDILQSGKGSEWEEINPS